MTEVERKLTEIVVELKKLNQRVAELEAAARLFKSYIRECKNDDTSEL